MKFGEVWEFCVKFGLGGVPPALAPQTDLEHVCTNFAQNLAVVLRVIDQGSRTTDDKDIKKPGHPKVTRL